MTLVTGAVTFAHIITCVRMEKRFLQRAVSERVEDRVVEMCCLPAFITWLPHFVHGTALSERREDLSFSVHFPHMAIQ